MRERLQLELKQLQEILHGNPRFLPRLPNDACVVRVRCLHGGLEVEVDSARGLASAPDPGLYARVHAAYDKVDEAAGGV